MVEPQLPKLMVYLQPGYALATPLKQTLPCLTRRAEMGRFLLRKAHDQLESRVRERTQELAETNAALRAEVTERKHQSHYPTIFR